MSQLLTLKELLKNPQESDSVLQFYLDNASDIICDIRNTNVVEPKYLTTQIKIAIELYNKQGAEGQVAHSENGINRAYEVADVSLSLLSTITPFVKTPYSSTRVII